MYKKKKIWLKIIFALVGASGAFLYWSMIGYTSGICPMKSAWYFSTLFGLALGYLLGDLTGSLIWRRAVENE